MTEIKIISDTVTQLKATDTGPQININMTRDRPQSKPTYTTGDVTVTAADFVAGRYFITTDSGPVNFFFKKSLPPGMIEVMQGGSGQVTNVPIEGAAFVNTDLRTAGVYSEKKKVQIYSFGDGSFLCYGDTTAGILEWSLVGPASLEEGDAAVYVLHYPDSVNGVPAGVAITIEGSNFDTSGLDQTLEQALTNLAKLEPNVIFDGVNQLVVKPGARNPLPLAFFAKPQYTALGNRSVGITISNPAVGTVADLAATVTTQIVNTSKPIAPKDIFVTRSKTVSIAASIGASTLTLSDVTDLAKFHVVTHASIPALTYITAISGNTVTLSASLTGAISQGSTISVKEAGFVLNFTSTTGMTKDGSERISQLLDEVHGFPFVQATDANKPVYSATAMNGVAGATTNGSQFLRCTNPAVAQLSDHARAMATIIVAGRLDNFGAITKNWTGGRFDLQAHTTNGVCCEAGSNNAVIEVQCADAIGEPYIFTYQNDGTTDGGDVHCNNQRQLVPATITATAAAGQRVIQVDDTSNFKPLMLVMVQPYGGIRSTVPCAVGINGGYQFLVTSVDSPTQITVNQNLLMDLQVGQPIYATSGIGFNRPPQTAAGTATANFTVGGDKSSSTAGVIGTFEYVVYIPRLLSPQEKRGIHLYIANQLSGTTNVTTSASAAAGTRKITLASLTGVHLYQTVSGTNIKPGSTIVKINTTTKDIWLDEDILAGGVASSATLTVKSMGIKIPDLMDVSTWTPLYREDYVYGPTLANSGKGQRPYSGDPNSPGTFNGAYAAYGHGSSNNFSAQTNFDLDPLNWPQWKPYTPFKRYKDASVAKGGLHIETRPVPAELRNIIGYDATDSLRYKYLGGYLRDAGAFSFQYGYCEGRMKLDNVIGMWAALWLLASNGGYPPEIDIVEVYGHSFASLQCTNHFCKTFNLDFAQQATGNNGEILLDTNSRYGIFGVDVRPDRCDFYLNREKIFSITMQWDFHTPWYIIVDMAVSTTQGGTVPDGVSIIDMFVDYLAVWRKPDDVITLTGTTQAETTALLAAMSVAPDSTRTNAINKLIETLKLTKTSFGDTLWSRFDGIVGLEMHDAQAARINWKDPTQIGTVVGSPTFVVNSGYAGTLNSAYIDMGFVLSADAGDWVNNSLNLYHVGAIASNITRTDAIAVGTSKFNMNPRSGNAFGTSLWTASAKTGGTAYTGGHYAATRNRFQYTYYHDGVLTNGGVGTGKPSTGNNTRTTDTDTLKIANGTSRIGFAHWGDYLTWDDIRLFMAAVRQYRIEIGAITG